MNIAIIPSKIFQDMIFQLIAPFSDLISWVVEHMGSGEFLPSNWLMDLIADFVCGERIMTMMKMAVTGCLSYEDAIVMRDADDDLTMLSCTGPNNPLEIICENVIFLLTGYDQ